MSKKIILFVIFISLISLSGCNEIEEKCTHNSFEWHVQSEPSCEENGERLKKCVSCGEELEKEIIDSLGHVYLDVLDSAVIPTEEYDGKEADKKCSRCDDLIIGSVIPKLIHEHTYSAEYSFDEQKHWKASICGHDVKGFEEDHSIENNECTVCGYKIETELEPSDYLLFKPYKSNTAYAVTGLRQDVDIKDVVIPTTYEDKPVICIGSNAFKDAKIDTVVIPEGITEIGENAFRDSSIKEIILPSTITKVYDYAFNNCSKLVKFTIHPSLKSSILVGNYETFGILDSLIEAEVPADLVQKLTTGSSYSSSKLKKLTVNFGKVIKKPSYEFTALETLILCEGVEEIDNGVFRNTKLVQVDFPASLYRIGSMAFSGAEQLETVNFDSNCMISVIDAWAFNTSGLVNITLPKSLTIIGNNAFTGSKVVSVTIPGSVKTISERCFSKCNELKEVIVEDGVEEIKLNAFSECQALETVKLPDSINKMEERVFEKCTSLTIVNIPKGITEIPQYTFNSCSSLVTCVIPSNIKTIGLSAFSSCLALNCVYFTIGLETISNYAFSGCKNLYYAALPDGIKAIGDYAFNAAKLKDVIVPNTVTYIGNSAFHSDTLLFFDGTKVSPEARYNCPILLFSESNPYSSQYWHYVDGIPTKWTNE